MVVDVVIINCTTRGCDVNMSNLEKAFSDDLFNITKVKPENCNDLYATKEIIDLFQDNDNPLLIVKDSSICQISPHSLSKMVRNALEHAKKNKIELVYLCSSGDQCEKQLDVHLFEDGTRLRTTQGNQSTQALLYTKKLKRRLSRQLFGNGKTLADVIREKIRNGELKAALFSPNIVHFDLELAASKSEFSSSNMCSSSQEQSNNTGLYIWLVILLILLIFLAWGLIQINPGYRNISPV